MAIYLKDARYLDWRTFELTGGNLMVEPGAKGGVSFCDEVEAGPADSVIDCSGKLVTKSFGCGHHHIYSTLARGMPAPPKIPENFVEILKYVWWRMDKCLDLDMIRSSALAQAIIMAKNGVTFCIDHHASPFAVTGSLGAIAEAFDEVGISHLLCYELSDRDGEESAQQGLAETDEFLSAGGQGHVGLHASFTVGDELLKNAIALARKHGTGLHVHVAEDNADQKDCLGKYGMRVVERLDEHGALELEQSILAHCVHLSDNEKKLVRESGVWVVQNTESNQNNNVGLTAYRDITQNVMLGTDGMHSDMLRSVKASLLAGQALEGMGYDEAYRRFRNVHRYAESFGASGDGDNNLIIMNYDAPTELTADNFLGHFVFGFEPRQIETVISKGRVIVDKGRAALVDEDEVFARAAEMGLKLWDAMSKIEV